jgi:Flp pilus assembly pilin Flp
LPPSTAPTSWFVPPVTRLAIDDHRPLPLPGSPIMSTISRFLRSESGATTAEYGIIIVVVAGIAIFVLSQLNGVMNILYGKFGDKVNMVN